VPTLAVQKELTVRGSAIFTPAEFQEAVELLASGKVRGQPLITHRLALLTVTGRRSGRTFTFPVAYQMDGDDRVALHVDWPERKLWWRNLRDGARVELRLAGVHRTGMAWARGDERSGVGVEVELDPR
jgi:hypothetical protein